MRLVIPWGHFVYSLCHRRPQGSVRQVQAQAARANQRRLTTNKSMRDSHNASTRVVPEQVGPPQPQPQQRSASRSRDARSPRPERPPPARTESDGHTLLGFQLMRLSTLSQSEPPASAPGVSLREISRKTGRPQNSASVRVPRELGRSSRPALLTPLGRAVCAPGHIARGRSL